MKNFFTKLFVVIILSVFFATSFGVDIVFAEERPVAPATGEIIDCPTCQGEVFVDVITNRGSGQGGGGQVTITG